MSEGYPKTTMTLRDKALEVMHGDANLPTTETLDAMPSEEIKLETDARAAIYIAAFKRSALTEHTQDVLVNWLADGDMRNLDRYNHIELAEHFKDKTPIFFNAVLEQYTEHFSQTESGQEFLDEFDIYREAYFTRSPAAKNKEKQYESIQLLIATGFVTGIMHIRGIMSRQDGAAIIAGKSVQETEKLIADSPHLALQVSKMSLADEERYVEASNVGGVDNNPVQITKGVYAFTSGLFARMHELRDTSDPQIAHRPHLQCPASISFPGEPSFNTDFWAWYNGVLAKAGYWDKQK